MGFYGNGIYYGDGELLGNDATPQRAPFIGTSVYPTPFRASTAYAPSAPRLPFRAIGVLDMDSDVIERKQGDTYPPIEDYLTDVNGVPLDLTGCTVTTTISTTLGVAFVNRAAATIVDAPSGWVRYQQLAADVASSGTFRLEWHVTRPDATEFRVPTGGVNDDGEVIPPYRTFTVVKNLS